MSAMCELGKERKKEGDLGVCILHCAVARQGDTERRRLSHSGWKTPQLPGPLLTSWCQSSDDTDDSDFHALIFA